MTLDTRMNFNTPDEGLVQPNPGKGLTGKKQKGKEEALKVKLEKRKQLLNIDRMTWYPNWRDLADNFIPYRGRFLVNDAWDTNKGWRRNWSIVDSTPLTANNTLRAGLSSGTSSEARPWFEYGLPATDEHILEESPESAAWLQLLTDKAREVLSESNYYQALSECFGEYGVFGIGALGREWPLPEKDEADVPRFQPFTIGSYYISQDKHRRVNTWFRDYRWTVQQIVEKFAIKRPDGSFDPEDDAAWVNISRYVRGLWDNGTLDQWISLVHAVEENPEYKPGAIGWRGMRFRSVTYERGGEPDRILADTKRVGKKNLNEAEKEEASKNLSVKGFRSFPVFCFRWYTNSEDAWGRGPAMDCLGDARALQLQQKRKAQAIDKHVDPPMVAHPNLRTQRTSLLPGDVTYVAPDGGQTQVGFQPAYIIKPDTEGLLEDIKETQSRIAEVMHKDIFQLFIQAERNSMGNQKMTAAQVNAEQQEKLLMLGPVLGQMNFDLFNPLHDWLVAEILRHGLMPPPPQALHGAKLHVKYISILAQAINAIKAEAIEKVTGYILQVGQLEQMDGNPALDKFNPDAAISEYAETVGAPASIIRSDEEVAQIRQQRQQQQQQAMQREQQLQAAQAANQHAQAAQTASETPTPGRGGGSLLDTLAGGAAGAGSVGG